MENVVMRVWLPDRPGALGAVATQIGAAGGDLVGIDILERGADRAIDELVVALPDLERVDALVASVSELSGVDVEEVRRADPTVRDPRLDALETASMLVGQRTVADLLGTLVAHARHDFDASWGVVIDPSSTTPLASTGEPPPQRWLRAFVEGSRMSLLVTKGDSGPDELAWASLDDAGWALVLGRHGRPFRARERHQLSALTRIADQRWFELAARSSRMLHPSAV